MKSNPLSSTPKCSTCSQIPIPHKHLLLVVEVRKARSAHSHMVYGLDVEESVSTDFPRLPNAVWTRKTEDGTQTFLYLLSVFSPRVSHIFPILFIDSSPLYQPLQRNKSVQMPSSKSIPRTTKRRGVVALSLAELVHRGKHRRGSTGSLYLVGLQRFVCKTYAF